METAPKTKKRKAVLPLWNVILHNDERIEFDYVILSVQKIIGLTEEESAAAVSEAHRTGQSLLMTTHFERAEMIKEKFETCQPAITVTIEPAQ